MADTREPGRVRSGWVRQDDGSWLPQADEDTPRARAKVTLKGLDESLEASHKRMARALAIETSRIEATAAAGALGPLDIEVLARLSSTWRTLVQNEPTKDYGDLTDDELKAKLAEVKRK
jgi:hypothetical protein